MPGFTEQIQVRQEHSCQQKNWWCKAIVFDKRSQSHVISELLNFLTHVRNIEQQTLFDFNNTTVDETGEDVNMKRFITILMSLHISQNHK